MLSYSDTAHSFCTSTDFPFCRSLQGSSQRIIGLHLIASSGSSSLAPNDSVTSFTICVTLLSDLLLALLAASTNFSIDIVTISPLNMSTISQSGLSGICSQTSNMAMSFWCPHSWSYGSLSPSDVHYNYTNSLNLVWILLSRVTEPTYSLWNVIWGCDMSFDQHPHVRLLLHKHIYWQAPVHPETMQFCGPATTCHHLLPWALFGGLLKAQWKENNPTNRKQQRTKQIQFAASDFILKSSKTNWISKSALHTNENNANFKKYSSLIKHLLQTESVSKQWGLGGGPSTLKMLLPLLFFQRSVQLKCHCGICDQNSLVLCLYDFCFRCLEIRSSSLTRRNYPLC